METENSLQKFTNEMSIPEIMNSTHKLTVESISDLNEARRNELNYYITHKLQTLQGDALDNFWYKVNDFIPEKHKNVTWDRNHVMIKLAIKNHLLYHKKFPTAFEISETTSLSRATISKHLKDLALFDCRDENYQIMNLMYKEMLEVLFVKALSGDCDSIKIVAKIMNKNDNSSKAGFKVNNQQNNFYQ